MSRANWIEWNRLGLGGLLVLTALLALVVPACMPTPGRAQEAAAPTATAAAETIRIATYNVEHFMRMFDQQRMPHRSRNTTELFRDEEDLYEVAAVMELRDFDADIICIQECCDEQGLRWFNEEYLDGEYEFVKVFRGNVDGQWLGMLARKGFEPLEVREYADEKDPVDDPELRSVKRRAGLDRGNLLFSRGPAFVLFATPGGGKIWVGTTHVKSKYGNNEAVTKWRIREMQRTAEIARELLGEGKTDLLYVGGDFNDEFGKDRFEEQIGRDAITVMQSAADGGESTRLVSPTRKLHEGNPRLSTYHCQIKPAYLRSFLDHVFLSPALAEGLKRTIIIDDPIAAVASDHYPVVVEVELPASSE